MNKSSGGGGLGLIVLVIIGWWFYNHHVRTDKPWWGGTENQQVCVVHNPTNSNCYTLPVTVEGKEIVEIGFPNGGYVEIVSTVCGKAVSFSGRYCDISDSQGRDYEVQKLE